MEASFRTRQIGSTNYRIALAGELNMYRAPEFRRDLHACLARRGSEVNVDLSAATFKRGGEISVVCPDSIRRIFDITGLDRVFTISEAPAEAVETSDVTIT